MAQYIELDALVVEIEKSLALVEKRLLKNNSYSHSGEIAWNRDKALYDRYEYFLSFVNTLEVKEVDLELITGWFDHIAQIADDRMTLTNQRMTDAHALDEIKCLAKNSSEFITKHYKAQKG